MYIPLLYLIGCGQTEVEDDTPESSEKTEVTSTEKSEPQSEKNQETKTSEKVDEEKAGQVPEVEKT